MFKFFFVYENLCVDTVNLIVFMDLSGIPWIFIYLLFMRGSLIYCTTLPHFLWLRLRHIKAHGDLGAPSLSYFLKNKSELNTQVRYDGFLYVVYVFEFFFVYENLCVDTVNLIVSMGLSGIPWIFIYLLLMRGFLIYCTTRPHFLWLRLRHIKAHGDLGVPSLSYFLKNKSELYTQVRYDRFLYVVYVFEFFCL